MSGVHWWPTATVSSVVAGAVQVVPFGELRTKILDCPLASSAPQTTCTPVASAATAGALKNREKVSPLGQANGPSAKDAVPRATGVTLIGLENVRPWSVERENSTALFGAKPSYCDQAT